MSKLENSFRPFVQQWSEVKTKKIFLFQPICPFANHLPKMTFWMSSGARRLQPIRCPFPEQSGLIESCRHCASFVPWPPRACTAEPEQLENLSTLSLHFVQTAEQSQKTGTQFRCEPGITLVICPSLDGKQAVSSANNLEKLDGKPLLEVRFWLGEKLGRPTEVDEFVDGRKDTCHTQPVDPQKNNATYLNNWGKLIIVQGRQYSDQKSILLLSSRAFWNQKLTFWKLCRFICHVPVLSRERRSSEVAYLTHHTVAIVDARGLICLFQFS